MNVVKNLMSRSSVLEAHVCSWCIWRGPSM